MGLQAVRRLLACGEQVNLGQVGVRRTGRAAGSARNLRVAFRKLGVEGGRIGPPGGRSAVEDAEVGGPPHRRSRPAGGAGAGLSATRRWSFASSSLSASRAPASSLAPRPSSRLSRTSISAFWRPIGPRVRPDREPHRCARPRPSRCRLEPPYRSEGRRRQRAGTRCSSSGSTRSFRLRSDSMCFDPRGETRRSSVVMVKTIRRPGRAGRGHSRKGRTWRAF